MEFKTVQTTRDPLFNKALQLYDAQLNVGLTEEPEIFKQSLENNMTQHDYVFLVGLENGEPISLATAHYEATTNSAFLIYLIALDRPDHDQVLSATFNHVEKEINALAQLVHGRDNNFIMFEADTTFVDANQALVDIMKHRKQFLYEQGFEKQERIHYLKPSTSGKGIPVDLFIKTSIPLTKDIYGPSIKSNYILKYVFANKMPRKIIYKLLVDMDLRKA